MKPIVIIGAGETAHLAYEYFTHDSNYTVAGFSQNQKYMTGSEFLGLPVVPLEEIRQHFPPSQYDGFVAMGSSRLNHDRADMYKTMKGLGYDLVSYISSRAFVWRNAVIGENCFIFEHNTVQPFVTIGNNVILWSGNHIGHRSVIGDNVFVSSHVVVAGSCEIGDNAFLGVNCTIIDKIKLEKDVFIGGGALVQKNVPAGSVIQSTSTETSKVSSYRLFRVEK